jgi:hypothetical protein
MLTFLGFGSEYVENVCTKALEPHSRFMIKMTDECMGSVLQSPVRSYPCSGRGAVVKFRSHPVSYPVRSTRDETAPVWNSAG